MLIRIILSLLLVFSFCLAQDAPPPQKGRLIVKNKFVVEPSSIAWVQFYIGRDELQANLRGRFRAQGGSGNDIEVFILDADGFENYSNGHTVPTYYNSGRVTVANIEAVIQHPGTYYLVMNNRFSAVSNKVVDVFLVTFK